MTNLDLNECYRPHDVVVALRAAAEQYAGVPPGEDPNAPQYRVWERIARILDHAAHRCEQVLKQEGW
jgi:hypothetical protein